RFWWAATRPPGPEVGAHVVREEPEHLIRHFPVRFGQSLVDEAIDREAYQAEAGLERQMQVIEHGPALLQEGRHVPHELGDDDLHVVARSRHALLEGGHAQLHESLDVGAAERRDFLAESTDLVQPGGADVIAPSTP